MAIGIYFAPAVMSAAQYDECVKALRKAGAGHPTGRTYHSAFGAPGKIQVFDVWTSQAAFDKFGKTLMPIMATLGIDPGQPTVMPIHNVITRPAAAKRAKVRKAPAKPPRKAARKAARRTGKKR